MSLLSKAEVQFLHGQIVVSKSYEYKLKSVIKKKLAILMEKELPLLRSFLPNLDLTKFGKKQDANLALSNLTKYSKLLVVDNTQNNPSNARVDGYITTNVGNFHPTRPSYYFTSEGFPKYYINNPSRLIKTAVGSGGVEVINQSNHTVRLSISPSQGDDPGFKSRPEHPLFGIILCVILSILIKMVLFSLCGLIGGN